MKIGPLDPKPAATPVAGERKASSTPAPGAEPSARVELSPAAALLSSAAGDGSFDTEKVARIAQAIRDGKFEVNAEAIADKLIYNARELLGKAGGG